MTPAPATPPINTEGVASLTPGFAGCHCPDTGVYTPRKRIADLPESGKVTHVDQEHLTELQATSPKNIAMLKNRLAELNARLGENKA